jgi:hypothetical protein
MLNPTEDHEQEVVAQYLDLLKVLWCHVPNGGMRNQIVAVKLKRQGTKRGVPDILIFDPPPCGGYVGCAIELKRKKGGTLSEEQKDWRDDLRMCGWFTAVCKGADEAIFLIQKMGYGIRK